MHTRLRQLRKSAGLTQAQLAVRAGLYQQDISRWERGRGHPLTPSFGTIIVIFCFGTICRMKGN